MYAYASGNPISNIDPLGLLDNTSPWQLGVEWLSGTGPRHHDFQDGDPFAETLRQHSHIQDLLADLCNGTRPANGLDPYKTDGLKGVLLYTEDYSNLLTGGLTGNLAVTYLGSYGLSYATAGNTVTMIITNTSSIASATRPPVLGYTPWWIKNIGDPLNSSLQTGPMSATTQTITLHQNLSQCTCKN